MPRTVRELFPGLCGEVELRGLSGLDVCAVTYRGVRQGAEVRVTVALEVLDDALEALSRARRGKAARAAAERGTYLDLIEADDGPHLFVVEPVEAFPPLPRRRRSPIEALGLLHDLSLALSQLHEDGSFHGRLSIASAGPRGLLDTLHAELGLRELDPSFRAPEQVEPRLGAEGPRTDVFALGVLFYWALQGAAPWSELSPAERLGALLDRSKRPSLRDAGAPVSPAVDAVIGRMLAVDPDARFADARRAVTALAEAVAASSESVPVRALPRFIGSAPDAARTSVRARPSADPRLVAAACFALLGVAFAGEAMFLHRAAATQASVVAVVASATESAPAPPSAPSAVVVAVAPAPSPTPPALATLLADMIAIPDTATARFEIDRTEVSVRLYSACIADGACTSTRKQGMGFRADDPVRKELLCNLHRPGRADHPINCVSRPQAAAYCAWAKKRLPTDAEWTLAAGPVRFPWGEGGLRCDRAVFARYGPEQGGCRKQPVGTAPVSAHPNGGTPSGVLGLAGNVWEWVSTPSEHGYGLLRGGAWDGNEHVLGSAGRLEQTIDNAEVTLGVRCVRGR